MGKASKSSGGSTKEKQNKPQPEAPTTPGNSNNNSSDIQSWCEVPSIAHFCSLFRQAFDLLEFDIQELEESLLLMGTEDDTSQLVLRLLIKLLKGCSRTFTNNITEDVSNISAREKFSNKNFLRNKIFYISHKWTYSLHLIFQNYNTYLRRLFLSKREEAEEDGIRNTIGFECRALLDDDIDFPGKVVKYNIKDVLFVPVLLF